MASSNKKELKLADGTKVEAFNPIIVSASRSTDIPAFYADWFFNRIETGYSLWENPFNRMKQYVMYEDTRFIIFWSKNPRPLLNYLNKLKERKIGCYIQYSLNNYEKERYEPNVPPYEERIDTFKKLVEMLGKGSVVWRNDPLILTDRIDIDELLVRLEETGDKLQGYTEKLVFSFVDILPYTKVCNNLKKLNIHYTIWTNELMKEFAKKLSILNKKWNYEIATCAEQIDLNSYGIKHNRCIDDELIARIAYNDEILMKYLGLNVKIREKTLFGDTSIPNGSIIINDRYYATRSKKTKDQGQRKDCGCIKSKDIGQYNTCKHFCVYCYANSGQKKVLENYEMHRNNPNKNTITGTDDNT